MNGFMAVHFHFLFFLFLLGPFWCAHNNLEIALSTCMVHPQLISVSELVAVTHATAAILAIDEPANMKNHSVYLFSGALDNVLVPGEVNFSNPYIYIYMIAHCSLCFK